MNPVHHVSLFFCSSFLHRKTPKYQLGSFTVHFSAMRTHAPSLVGGLAAVSASCLPKNVRPGGREGTMKDGVSIYTRENLSFVGM